MTGSETFVYTIEATFPVISTTKEATSAIITDFFPSNVVYTLPTIDGYLKNITETAEEGGTLVTFDFGELAEEITVTFEIQVHFGEGRRDGDTFSNVATLYQNGEKRAKDTAELVTLTLISDFSLTKSMITKGTPSAGEEVYFRLVLENKGDGGATISDVQFQDILPVGLVPDLNFSIIGYDDSVTFPDTSADGQFGSWNGQTMTFDLSSYSGTRYVIEVHTQVDLRATPGAILTNTAEWTVDEVEQTSSSVEVTISSTSPVDTMYQAISDIVESIALEEAGIFAILDAEGAKIQKAVALQLSDEKLLAVNTSVESMVTTLTDLEEVLKAKLSLVLENATN